MEKQKMPIQHVTLYKFKNNENSTETAKKMCSVYGQVVITDQQIWNWFSKFCYCGMSLRDEHRPGCSSEFKQDVLKNIAGCSPHKHTQKLALDPNTFQSTIWKRLLKRGNCAFDFLIFIQRRVSKITYL